MPHQSFRQRRAGASPPRVVRDTTPPGLARSPVIKRSVIIGGQKRFAIRLRLDADRMAAHRVTVTDVDRALKSLIGEPDVVGKAESPARIKR